MEATAEHEAGRPLDRLVRARRLELQLSQRQAADRAGVSLGTWSAVERPGEGTSFQDLTLHRVAAALGLPTREVFASAGRPWQDPEPGDAGEPPVAEVPDVTGLVARLRSLARRSPEDYAVVAGVVAQLVDHLMAGPDEPGPA